MLSQTLSNHTLTRGFWVSYGVCMKQMLTTKSLDAMPPSILKRYEVRDQKVNGLHVRVSTTGAKVFYTMVRPNGSRRRVKIGPYPVVSLADAKRRAMEISRDVELGEFDKTPEVSEASTETLGEMVIPPKISGVQEWNFLGKISEEIYDEKWTI